MKTNIKKTKKAVDDQKWINSYTITEMDLEGKDSSTLEYCLKSIEEGNKKNYESFKNLDNKANLLLVLYVGIFTLFSYCIANFNCLNQFVKILYYIFFGLTVASYLISIIVLLITIKAKPILDLTPKSICEPGIKKYEDWLKSQIISKSANAYKNDKTLSKKAKCFSFGRICLVISVSLTLCFTVFIGVII